MKINFYLLVIYNIFVFSLILNAESYQILVTSNPDEVISIFNENNNNAKNFDLVNLKTNKVSNINLSAFNFSYFKLVKSMPDYLALFMSDKIVYYNYRTNTSYNSPVYLIINSEKEIEFSADGNKFYTFNYNTFKLNEYNTNDSKLIKTKTLNVNPNLYIDFVFNEYKDELCLKRSDSLEIWSLKTKEIVRVIPIDENASKIVFYSNGNYGIYSINKNEVKTFNYSDGKINNNFKPNRDFEDYRILENVNRISFELFGSDFNYSDFQTFYTLDSANLISENYKDDFISGEYFILYFSDNLDKTIVIKYEDIDCPSCDDLPNSSPVTVNYLIDNKNKDLLSSIPEGYVYDPGNMIFNKDGSLSALFSYNDRKNHIALLTKENKFIKYINVDSGSVHSFSLDSKYLNIYHNRKAIIYNIEKDLIEKEILTDLEWISRIYLVDNGLKKIVVCNNQKICVYDFDKSTLDYKIDIKDSNNQVIMQIDMFSNINYIIGDFAYKFNPYTGESIKSPKIVLPTNSNHYLRDFSFDGKYALYWLASAPNDSAIVYDIYNQKIKYGLKLNSYIGSPADIRFLGCHYIIKVTNCYPIMYESFSSFIFNFETNNKSNNTKWFTYYYTTQTSLNGKYYGIIGCPKFYTISSNPFYVSVENENPEFSNNTLYPNPATDYIEISLDSPSIKRGLGDALSLSKWGVSLEIYNIFGEKESTPSSLRDATPQEGNFRIDVSNLAPGVYFIKIGDRFEKFIKM